MTPATGPVQRTQVALKPRVCVYCLAPLERRQRQKEHVVAQQFFPQEAQWLDDLVTVPSCKGCNQEKQRAEDIVGVLMPIGDTSPGARRVLMERIPRTLKKNRRLHRSLYESYVTWWLHEGGVFRPRRALVLSPWHQQAFFKWYQFIIKGLYWEEHRRPLPALFEICLIKPWPGARARLMIDVFRQLAPKVKKRSLAGGEFLYAFAVAERDPVSLWWVQFRSTEMAAVTLPPGPSAVREALQPFEWTPPPLPATEPGLIIAPW